MDDLHESIAAFLRAQLPPPAPPEPIRERPQFPQRPVFTCRYCGCPVERDGERYHVEELWESGRCAGCHEMGLARRASYVAKRATPAQLRQMAFNAAARCRHCGQVLPPSDGDVAAERARGLRICEDCHYESLPPAEEIVADLAEVAEFWQLLGARGYRRFEQGNTAIAIVAIHDNQWFLVRFHRADRPVDRIQGVYEDVRGEIAALPPRRTGVVRQFDAGLAEGEAEGAF